MAALPALVSVWIIQETRSGLFLGSDLQLHQSMKRAGRLYSEESARDTAVCQFSYDYEIHSFYEFDE